MLSIPQAERPGLGLWVAPVKPDVQHSVLWMQTKAKADWNWLSQADFLSAASTVLSFSFPPGSLWSNCSISSSKHFKAQPHFLLAPHILTLYFSFSLSAVHHSVPSIVPVNFGTVIVVSTHSGSNCDFTRFHFYSEPLKLLCFSYVTDTLPKLLLNMDGMTSKAFLHKYNNWIQDTVSLADGEWFKQIPVVWKKRFAALYLYLNFFNYFAL